MGLLDRQPILPTSPNFTLSAYMGDWFVQGHIPLAPEADAHNAVESYRSAGDGEVAVAYAFRKGSFTGPLEIMTPTGFPSDDDPAEWGMRFVWPFRAEYIVAYVDRGHTETIVGRTSRDYVWIMTRERIVDEERYGSLLSRVEAMGYSSKDVRRVPQRWPDDGHPASGNATEESMADRYT